MSRKETILTQIPESTKRLADERVLGAVKMRFAYADPPYIRQAKRHYKNEELCSEVNHRVLLGYLTENFDGWALSCSSSSLKEILTMDTCPDDVRIGAWVKPFCSFKANVNPAYAWEPVIFWNAKKRGRDVPTVRDFVSENITLRKGLSGAKPVKFCYWIFELLGLEEHDDFVDVFPGTRIVETAWRSWRERKQPKELQMKAFSIAP